MGIALPPWVNDAKNSIWILGVYGIIFGGALPYLVVSTLYSRRLPFFQCIFQGKWWFGNRQKTKDGINAKSAAAFFTTLKEEATMDEIVGTLGKAYQWDLPVSKTSKSEEAVLEDLEKQIIEKAGSKYTDVLKIATGHSGIREARKKALILIYSHLLRIEIRHNHLRQGN